MYNSFDKNTKLLVSSMLLPHSLSRNRHKSVKLRISHCYKWAKEAAGGE